MASNAVSSEFASRDEVKDQKKLAEDRQSGKAAAEIDEATGKMINPHNPQFIVQAPWYLNQNAPSLKHHNAWKTQKVGTNQWFKRGTKGDVKTKFQKGACENCGAMTHSKKDCMERPRAAGAKHTGKDLASDDFIEHLDLDYAGAHDRWNGFVADDYQQVVEQFEKADALRKKEKELEHERKKMIRNGELRNKRRKKKKDRKIAQRKAAGGGSDSDTAFDSDSDSDTDTETDTDSDGSGNEDLGERIKDFEKQGVVGTRDNRVRTTTRNLRIREDTARYLINLDVNSAYYDPKARAMRDNPLKNLAEKEQGVYRGDNANRGRGDTNELRKLEIFCWDAYKNGTDIHEQAMPTQAALMYSQVIGRKDELVKARDDVLKNKYNAGDQEALPQELMNATNDQYVEYNRDGTILHGRERALMKSKYEEDLLNGNHTKIWGSWYCSDKHRWGYACCKQTLKASYCIREKNADTPKVSDEPEVLVESIVELPPVPAENSPKKSLPPVPVFGKPLVDPETLMFANENYREKRLLAENDDCEGDAEDEGSRRRGLLAAMKREKRKKKESEKAAAESNKPPPSATQIGHDIENTDTIDPKKLRKAARAAKKRLREEIPSDKDRKYNSGIESNSTQLTAEELEAHRLTKIRNFDPCANFE